MVPYNSQEPSAGFFDKMVDQAYNALSSLATWENAASALEMAAAALFLPPALCNRASEIYRIHNAVDALRKAGVETSLLDSLKDELKYYQSQDGIWVVPYTTAPQNPELAQASTAQPPEEKVTQH